MLNILIPPFCLRSAHDIVGEPTGRMFRKGGVSARVDDLWPNWIAAPLNSGRIPFGRRLFAWIAAPLAAHRTLADIKKGDLVWVLGPVVPRVPEPHFERRLIARGAKYIFHIMDDWFEVPFLREGTLRRAKIADLIVVPTPALLERVLQELPEAKVVRLEEPVDTGRVYPTKPNLIDSDPVIVWTGNPTNLFLLDLVREALHSLAETRKFRLRIISQKRPTQGFSFPWEWCRYDYRNESDLLAGAIAGLAPLDDTPFNRSKGIYKVKTYMAAGLPVVGSAVGYQTALVKNGETGFLCHTLSEWVEALGTFIDTPATAKKMGTAARAMALQRFSHDAVSDSWIEAIRFLQ